MPIKKKKDIKHIREDFNKVTDLIFAQLTLLEELITDNNQKIDSNIIKEAEEKENQIDDLEIKISDEIVNILVLQSPVASELRMVIAIQRMVINLERIGDLIMNIIYFISRIADKQLPEKYSQSISNMLVITTSMVRKSLKSFELKDKDYAIWTIKNDDTVDELYHNIVKNIINKAKLDENTRKMFFDFMNINNIISNVERIADNATNIAEASIYYLKGVDLRHNNTDLSEIEDN